MTDLEPGAWAAVFFGAIETGDVDTVERLYDDSITVWHNETGQAQTKSENLEVLRTLTSALRDVRYLDRRIDVFDSGFVQQHVLAATGVRGQQVTLPAAVVVHLRAGVAVCIEEYYDSARADVFRAAFG